MEATQANVSSGCVNHAVSLGFNNQLAETLASVHPTTTPRFESYHGLMAAYPQNTRPGDSSDNQFQDSIKHPGSGCQSRMQAPVPSAGVSNCYVFKSRLQEYAQKVGLSTPSYETIREGPSHEPSFRSTVIVGDARYDSLHGFFNRKAAEQSAAEVALMELCASGKKIESISVPVHETGLCKNVLQEYAQKMNYAVPTYVCKKDGSCSRTSLYSCTVDIGGIQYIGAAARTKKEAEIKAARTALLAIRSSGNVGGELGGKTNYTVVPCKRKVPETTSSQGETSKPKKSKKPRFRKKPRKHMHPGISGNQIQAVDMAICVNNNMGTPVAYQNIQVADNGQSVYCLETSAHVNGETNVIAHIGEPSGGEGDANTVSGYSVVSITGANSYNGSTNITPLVSATSSQLDALLLDYGVDQRGEAPTMTDTNHAKEGNNTRASEQLDAVNSDSTIEAGNPVHGLTDPDYVVDQRREAPTMTDTNHAKEGNDDHGAGSIVHLVNSRASEQLDGVNSDSRIGHGDLVDATNVLIPGSDQTVKNPDGNAEG